MTKYSRLTTSLQTILPKRRKTMTKPIAKPAMKRRYPLAWHAVQFARQMERSGATDYPRMCLKFVRECWGLDRKYSTAREAWMNSEHRHPFTTEDDIPFGAPVFSGRPNAPASDAGHVFIAGGYDESGRRVYRSNDTHVLGGISTIHLDVITKGWGHSVLGWTSELNGEKLDLPPSPNQRKRRNKG